MRQMTSSRQTVTYDYSAAPPKSGEGIIANRVIFPRCLSAQ